MNYDSDYIWAHTCHRRGRVYFLPWPRLVCSMCHPRWIEICTDISLPRSDFEAERERVERRWNEELTTEERAAERNEAVRKSQLRHADIWERRRNGLDLPS